MNNARILPLSRNGTTGICNEFTLPAATTEGERAFLAVPERIASIGWQVAIPRGVGNKAHIVIETSMNMPDTLGDTGSGGIWANVYNVDEIIRLDGEERGKRIAADGTITETIDGSCVIERADGTETSYINPYITDTGCVANTVRGIRVTVLWSTCPVEVAFCG